MKDSFWAFFNSWTQYYTAAVDLIAHYFKEENSIIFMLNFYGMSVNFLLLIGKMLQV